jgi:membrane-associated protease RseP (regulator of RpoE activity)
VSVIWGLLNLLPIYPLDGGNIAREIVTAISPRRGIAISLGLSALIAAGIAVHLLLRSLNSHSPIPFFTILLFGYLAYSSFVAFEVYQHRRPW